MTTISEDAKQGAPTQGQAAPASPAQQAPSGVNPPTPAPGNEGRKISAADIQLVQNLIERCLQLYMNQTEVIATLKSQAKIEPRFTSLVWQKLEEQNLDFFKAYYTQLKVKKQILLFNHFLEQHVQLLQKMQTYPPTIAMVPQIQNGMQPSLMHHMPMGYPVSAGPPNVVIPHMSPMPIQVPNGNIMNGANSVQEYTASHGSPGSNMENPTDITGMQMGSTPSMGMDTPFIPNEPVQNGIEALTMPTTEEDTSGTRESLGSLVQLPRNFSLSDLTAELSSNAELGGLGSYTGSPFLTPDTEAFLQSPDKEFAGFGDDDSILDSIGENLNIDFDDFK